MITTPFNWHSDVWMSAVWVVTFPVYLVLSPTEFHHMRLEFFICVIGAYNTDVSVFLVFGNVSFINE